MPFLPRSTCQHRCFASQPLGRGAGPREPPGAMLSCSYASTVLLGMGAWVALGHLI